VGVRDRPSDAGWSPVMLKAWCPSTLAVPPLTSGST
jgi:hypothetical protein